MIYWTEMFRGGYFVALEVPDFLTKVVGKFFWSVRARFAFAQSESK